MLRQRIIVTILLLPILIWVIVQGDWIYVLVVGAALGLAASEYGLLFRRGGLAPSLPLLVVGVLGLAVARFLVTFGDQALLLAALGLAGMTWHLVDYERGAERSGTDFAVTLSGLLYLGWIGSYLISLRMLPDGQWWILVVLPSVWIGDSAAYLIGSWIGRNRMSPRLSPKKTWEGYLSGILFGGLSGAALATLWRAGISADIGLTAQTGLVVGTAVAAISPLGDLGISMIKREMQAKHSSTLLPGHGGMLDRFDSWLWAGALGYYAVLWLA
jgi:phosphatidate cytidylyltransferase